MKLEHHIFCNNWTRPVDTCSLCADLRSRISDLSPLEALDYIDEHYPTAQVIIDE